MSTRRIPDATVDRLPVYLRALFELGAAGQAMVSSDELAEMAGVNAAKVRKDLSHLGSYGTRGVGYDVEYLRFEITSRLGLASESLVAIVGMGNLGRALANHAGFRDRGFPLAALYDNDPEKIGSEVNGYMIRPVETLGAPSGPVIAIGVITTPPDVAQDVADRLVGAGVRAILNFAPTVIHVPPEVTLRKVDLTHELQVLSFYQQRDAGDRPVGIAHSGSSGSR
ncbi:MAG: redox-sensing transcriptional repressor Rex [Acidimicrobiales bacterium]